VKVHIGTTMQQLDFGHGNPYALGMELVQVPKWQNFWSKIQTMVTWQSY